MRIELVYLHIHFKSKQNHISEATGNTHFFLEIRDSIMVYYNIIQSSVKVLRIVKEMFSLFCARFVLISACQKLHLVNNWNSEPRNQSEPKAKRRPYFLLTRVKSGKMRIAFDAQDLMIFHSMMLQAWDKGMGQKKISEFPGPVVRKPVQILTSR